MSEKGEFNPEGLQKVKVDKDQPVVSLSKENSKPQTELEDKRREINNLFDEIKKEEEVQGQETVYEYGIEVPKLDQSEKKELKFKLKKIKKDSRFVLPALFKGNKTATNYNSDATNYSTVTNNVVLESGRELFAIYNYRSSWVHRILDTFCKKISGLPMRKANYRDWPETFRENSLLPVLDLVDNNGKVDGNMVVLERIPNVNVFDLIANFDDLKNPESEVDGCDFIKDMKKEDLMGIVGRFSQEVAKIHNEGKTWGDLVPSNIIIDKNQKIHICDPETIYSKKLSIEKQKAFDLLECTTSFSSVMNKNHQIPYSETINTILNNYVTLVKDNEKVIAELKKIAEKKLTILNRLGFVYLKAHLSVQSRLELMEIRKIISEFEKR